MKYDYLFLAIICILLILILILLIVNGKLKNEKKNNLELLQLKEKEESSIKSSQSHAIDVEGKTPIQDYPFKKVYLLTKNEWNFYRRLKSIIDKYNLSIIAKVRLADLVEVDEIKTTNFQADFDRIKSKHIDFAVVKSENMEVKFLIELDDNTHNYPDRKSRDMFINKLCNVTKYQLIRTNGDTKEIENILINNYSTFKKPEVQPQKQTENIDDKLLKQIFYKVNNIEKILTEIDEEPYIIKSKEDE